MALRLRSTYLSNQEHRDFQGTAVGKICCRKASAKGRVRARQQKIEKREPLDSHRRGHHLGTWGHRLCRREWIADSSEKRCHEKRGQVNELTGYTPRSYPLALHGHHGRLSRSSKRHRHFRKHSTSRDYYGSRGLRGKQRRRKTGHDDARTAAGRASTRVMPVDGRETSATHV